MRIEVFTKDEFDRESKNISESFFSFSQIKGNIKFSKIYDIKAEEKEEYFKKIAEDILVDPVVEYYILGEKTPRPFNFNVSIEVWFKKGVTDVVGESVKNIIGVYGMRMPDDAQSARCYYFSLKADKNILKEFIYENFANELINDIRLRLKKD
ncbi:MAG: hypothetical protein K6357_02620 [Elusimicrobiota bacterium]